MKQPSRTFIDGMRRTLSGTAEQNLNLAIHKIVEAKQRGGRVVVVTGSGPNIHEGVTTLIASMIHKGLVDGVITSSAVIAHEMGGTLDRVKRIPMGSDDKLPILPALLPRGDVFELTVLTPQQRASLEPEMAGGWDLYDHYFPHDGNTVIKAAGNMAWPMGLRTERISLEIRDMARKTGDTFESVAGRAADAMTMIGAGAARGVPVLVSIPQMIGGGAVGFAVGDSTSIESRSRLIADLLGQADVIVESAVALTQEIHDGPFETYTGHGIWAAWDGHPTYSLRDKTLVRIDLDANLERAWRMERESSDVQHAVNQGLPKTKRTGIPFRMEMSGFARLEGSIPVTADIGVVWPIIADACAQALSVDLDFMSAPQESDEGKQMREWIADHVRFLDRRKLTHAR